MRTSLGHDIAAIAASLDDGAIHVWQLDYDRSLHRAPLHKVLGAYLGLPPDDVVLQQNEHGRPELSPPWDRFLRFNWSHTVDRALIAVARGIQPGVDIERVRPRPRALEIAQRFFHRDELRALEVLADIRRDYAFAQLWTGKEAILKAVGRGIAFGLDRLCLSVAEAEPRLRWMDGDDVAEWNLRRIDVGSDYVARLAWRGPACTVASWTLAAEP